MVIAYPSTFSASFNIVKGFEKCLKKFQELEAQVYVFIKHTHLGTSFQV